MKKNKKTFVEVNMEAREQYLASTKELDDAGFLTGLTRLVGEGCAKRGIDPVWATEKMIGAVKLGMLFGAFMNEPEEEAEDEDDEEFKALKEAYNEEHHS